MKEDFREGLRGIYEPPEETGSIKSLDYDEEVVLTTYLEELPPLTRKQRQWLGGWLCGRFTVYGVPKTQANLAAFRGVSRQRIDQEEAKVKRKIRRYLHCHPEVRDELAALFGL